MPMSGTTYVNPGWKEAGPPAISAAELNAISDTLAGAQAKNTSQDALIAALQTAVGAKGQMAFGSYTGTGLYGSGNPTSLTVPFAPKLVWMFGYKKTINSGQTGIVEINDNTNSTYSMLETNLLTTSYSNTGPTWLSGSQRDALIAQTQYIKKSSDGKTISWYSDYAAVYGDNLKNYAINAQFNGLNSTYFWIAFG